MEMVGLERSKYGSDEHENSRNVVWLQDIGTLAQNDHGKHGEMGVFGNPFFGKAVIGKAEVLTNQDIDGV